MPNSRVGALGIHPIITVLETEAPDFKGGPQSAHLAGCPHTIS